MVRNDTAESNPMNATSSKPAEFKTAAQYLAEVNVARDRLADAYRLMSAVLGNGEHDFCANPRNEAIVAKALCHAEQLAIGALESLQRCAAFAREIGGAS